MRIGRLIALAFVVVGLGAYIALYERHQPTTDERKEQADKIFVGFDQAKAKKVLITNSHGTFELVKEKDAWALEGTARRPGQRGRGVEPAVLGLRPQGGAHAQGGRRSSSPTTDSRSPLWRRHDRRTRRGRAFALKLGGDLPLGKPARRGDVRRERLPREQVHRERPRQGPRRRGAPTSSRRCSRATWRR